MDNQITCIIIDDELEARDVLEELLRKFSEVEVLGKLSNVDEGIVAFLKHKPSLVFVDVQMPQKDGFEFIHQIQNFAIDTTVVFVTAYHQYAVEAIKHSAFDYLLKPINQKELQKTIERFKSKTEKENLSKNINLLLNNISDSKKLKLNTRTGFELVSAEKILFLEADRNYSHIHCINGDKMLSTQNLGSIEEMLPGNDFFRISRSHIININHLAAVDKKKKQCKLSDIEAQPLKLARDRMKILEERL